MSVSMPMQNLVKLNQFSLKILSGNEVYDHKQPENNIQPHTSYAGEGGIKIKSLCHSPWLGLQMIGALQVVGVTPGWEMWTLAATIAKWLEVL